MFAGLEWSPLIGDKYGDAPQGEITPEGSVKHTFWGFAFFGSRSATHISGSEAHSVIAAGQVSEVVFVSYEVIRTSDENWQESRWSLGNYSRQRGVMAVAVKNKQAVIIRVSESWGEDRERLNLGLQLWAEYLSRHVPQLLAEARRQSEARQENSRADAVNSHRPSEMKQAVRA